MKEPKFKPVIYICVEPNSKMEGKLVVANTAQYSDVYREMTYGENKAKQPLFRWQQYNPIDQKHQDLLKRAEENGNDIANADVLAMLEAKKDIYLTSQTAAATAASVAKRKAEKEAKEAANQQNS